jgi:hypothetical protein
MVGSSIFKDKWIEDMRQIVLEGVGGLMDLTVDLEKMVSPEKRRPEEQNMPIIHRTSVVGLFIRRIILCFDKLNFSEVSHLYHNFKQYCEQDHILDQSANERLGDINRTIGDSNHVLGHTTPRNVRLTNVASTSSSLPTTSTPDLEISSFSEEVSNINNRHSNQNLRKSKDSTAFEDSRQNCRNEFSELNKASFIPNRMTRTQAELYIANQVELLQTSEANG